MATKSTSLSKSTDAPNAVQKRVKSKSKKIKKCALFAEREFQWSDSAITGVVSSKVGKTILSKNHLPFFFLLIPSPCPLLFSLARVREKKFLPNK